MKLIHFFILFILLFSCSQQPTKLSDKREKIVVSYVNWACNCADFIESKYYEKKNYEVKDEDCIFIEPANDSLKIKPEDYEKLSFEKDLILTGNFYLDKGVPKSYEPKTESSTEEARVFRYNKIEFTDKSK